jgi:hypothetical protein
MGTGCSPFFDTVVKENGFQVLLKCLQALSMELLHKGSAVAHPCRNVILIRSVSEGTSSEVIQ